MKSSDTYNKFDLINKYAAVLFISMVRSNRCPKRLKLGHNDLGSQGIAALGGGETLPFHSLFSICASIDPIRMLRV